MVNTTTCLINLQPQLTKMLYFIKLERKVFFFLLYTRPRVVLSTVGNTCCNLRFIILIGIIYAFCNFWLLDLVTHFNCPKFNWIVNLSNRKRLRMIRWPLEMWFIITYIDFFTLHSTSQDTIDNSINTLHFLYSSIVNLIK